MAIKLKKTLYIGLGGTGVATLLKIKKCFIDSYGEVPPMIGFLAIDTDSAANNKSVTGNRGQEIRLDASELLVCTVKGALSVYNASPRTYDWVPQKNIAKLQTIQGFGAGQVRSNGRFIAYYNNKDIKNNIQAAVNKIHQLIPQGSKYSVDTNISGIEFPASVNVIASVAGGTGSGMLIDVLCIVREAMREQAASYNLYPWILLPETFKAMNNSPAMANVLYNSYGALRTLDYIQHHNPKNAAINFGYAKIDSPLFNYAYILNNMNQAGVSFNNIDDLVDVIAKSAFLPANKMGDDLQSPFDNIVGQQMGGTYDIRDKKAWAASASSAELIYDSQAVGRAYAHRLIRQLCDSMLQSEGDGTDDANRFFDDPNVLIRENLGQDNIIDALLSPTPEYSLEIDDNTAETDISNYLDYNYGNRLESQLQEALDRKLRNTQLCFEEYLVKIMSIPQGKIDAAIKFINALQGIINLCKGEMEEEGKAFNAQNLIPVQWDVLLNSTKRKGIIGVFSKVNADAVEALQSKLVEVVTSHREEIRRLWALKFYNAFEDIINGKLQDLNILKAHIEQIAQKSTALLQQEQYLAQSTSKFQIFLHQEDLQGVSRYKIDDSIKSSFIQYLNEGASKWIGLSEDAVQQQLWDFAKESAPVLSAVNKNIDDILVAMPTEKVKEYLSHLKILASPLWTYNTQGFNDSNLQLDRFVIVGVGNRDTSILSKNAAFSTFFDTNGNKTNFASTNQYDRVYVLVVEDLLPIYAVNNFTAYQRDSEEKEARNFMMANYLDEKLNNRIIADGFSILPRIETDNVLQLWVYGFIFGYIHYDGAANQYWMRSIKRGEALDNFRFDLSNQRDVAFDIFKSEGLFKEVEEGLNKQISRNGEEPIAQKLQEIKDQNSYLESYAQLSPLEASQIRTDKFKPVKDLLTKEIGLMTEK